MASPRSTTFLTETKVHSNNDVNPTREMKVLEPLEAGISHMSQSTLLLKKKKEMREVNDALELMKEEFAQRIQVCNEREKEFDSKQHEMKDQVAKFEKFIRENDAKRLRAEVKAKMEHRLVEQNEAKKKMLQKELQKDDNIRSTLDEKLEQLFKYRVYLERTVDASEDEYSEIGDILNRYATLGEANKDLKLQVSLAETQMDELRQNLIQFKRESQNRILVQNSEIHGYQQQVEKLRAAALQLDLDKERNEKVANDMNREMGQVILTVKNLYHRCLSSMRIRAPPIHDDQGQDHLTFMNHCMKVVGERILDLEYIKNNYSDNRVNC